jgi:hypothetical protein
MCLEKASDAARKVNLSVKCETERDLKDYIHFKEDG